MFQIKQYGYTSYQKQQEPAHDSTNVFFLLPSPSEVLQTKVFFVSLVPIGADKLAIDKAWKTQNVRKIDLVIF